VTTLGIIGAGQLGQMLGFACKPLGVNCLFLDPSPQPPALAAGDVLSFPFNDQTGLAELAHRADVLTYEFENVPVDALQGVAASTPVYPPPEALRSAQDRLTEKRLFRMLEIPTAEFRNVESDAELQNAARELGLPLVLKTRRFGYDGKGQSVIRDQRQLGKAWQEIGSVPSIAERLVPFDYEVSAIGTRSIGAEIVSYPLTENQHRDGILRTSLAPAGDQDLAGLAADYHARLLNHLQYVGTLALELFVMGGELVANEFAPRVHNSGHWTIEGAATSQFENHVRAVLGMGLGDPSNVGHAAMKNLIGSLPSRLAQIRDEGFYVHEYGKSARPNRKLGHITVVGETAAERDTQLARLQSLLAG
jgi:5-(carboxyamino)imidazole ribonucleotide synthase